jgi:hypothetical protein
MNSALTLLKSVQNCSFTPVFSMLFFPRVAPRESTRWPLIGSWERRFCRSALRAFNFALNSPGTSQTSRRSLRKRLRLPRFTLPQSCILLVQACDPPISQACIPTHFHIHSPASKNDRLLPVPAESAPTQTWSPPNFPSRTILRGTRLNVNSCKMRQSV